MDIQDALEIVSQTNPGMVRSHNEDSVSYDADLGLVVLADGMGGYNAGEVASGISVSAMSSEVKHQLENARPEDQDASGEDLGVILLRDNVKKANLSIFHAAQSQPQYAGMGTTIVIGPVLRRPRGGGACRRFAHVPFAGRGVREHYARSFPAAGADRQRNDQQGRCALVQEQESGDARSGYRRGRRTRNAYASRFRSGISICCAPTA